MTNPRLRAVALSDEALETVTGDRQRDYDSPSVNLTRTAALWEACRPQGPFTARKVAQFMRLVKESRECSNHKRDNLVDIMGFSLCDEMLDEVDE